MEQAASTTTTACETCGRPVAPGQLVCPNCGGLVYRRRLEQLAADALRLEAVNPPLAAMAWRHALDLLPPHSQQFQQIYPPLREIATRLAPAGGSRPHPH